MPKCCQLLALYSALTSRALAEFCAAELYTGEIPCDDGSVLQSGKCCSGANYCPSSCSSAAMSGGSSGQTCTCGGCAKKLKLTLSESDRWVKAHNYFRCRHGQKDLTWSAAVATNAKIPADQSCALNNMKHSKSYAMTPSAGENLAMGQNSPEAATEAWYSEITSAASGQGYKAGTSSGDAIYSASENDAVGHYTALIWAASKKVGCKKCSSSSGSTFWACQYADSPPNVGEVSDYVANVPQKNAATATAAACCTKVYGASSNNATTAAAGNGTTTRKTGLTASVSHRHSALTLSVFFIVVLASASLS